MTDIQLYKEIESLPDNLKKQALDYVALLKKQARLSSKTVKLKERKPGILKGKIKISVDFDSPLKEFDDYM